MIFTVSSFCLAIHKARDKKSPALLLKSGALLITQSDGPLVVRRSGAGLLLRLVSGRVVGPVERRDYRSHDHHAHHRQSGGLESLDVKTLGLAGHHERDARRQHHGHDDGRDGGAGGVAQVTGGFQHARCKPPVLRGQSAHHSCVVHRVEDIGAERDGQQQQRQQPEIDPGQTFHYTSGTIIETEFGTMLGGYEMQTSAGEKFIAKIPPFLLSLPHKVH